MSKGENIFKRKDGRWEARYVKGYELSGKIKYGFCYGKTYREAKEKFTRAKPALLSGKPTPVTNSRHRFAWFCDQWFESSQSRFKESTCVKYKTILDKHIKPKQGGCFPLGFHDALIERFTNELLFEEELAPKTVKDILVVLRSILDYTAKRFPETFPRVDIVYPKEGRKEMRVLTREEQSTFLLAIALVGVRLVGLQVFTVLSGSMEPNYHVGSLIYVKSVDYKELEPGDVITFMLDEDTVATHRITEVLPDKTDGEALRFRTKGDANDAEDGSLVHYKNIIGSPLLTIPYLGYFAHYIQNPPGTYVAISVGALLLLLVFLPDLFSSDDNQYEDARAGREAESLLGDVQTIIEEQKTAASPAAAEEAPAPESPAPELPLAEIEGYDYVGVLSIPKLELELPVMAQWDYERLKIAPCCHFGSSRTDDLVIAAHNYKKHFGSLYLLEAGDQLRFTEMDGTDNLYEVTGVDTLSPTEVDAVQNSGHDLVLYTCTYSGQERVTAFCDRVEDTPLGAAEELEAE